MCVDALRKVNLYPSLNNYTTSVGLKFANNKYILQGYFFRLDSNLITIETYRLHVALGTFCKLKNINTCILTVLFVCNKFVKFTKLNRDEPSTKMIPKRLCLVAVMSIKTMDLSSLYPRKWSSSGQTWLLNNQGCGCPLRSTSVIKPRAQSPYYVIRTFVLASLQPYIVLMCSHQLCHGGKIVSAQ